MQLVNHNGDIWCDARKEFPADRPTLIIRTHARDTTGCDGVLRPAASNGPCRRDRRTAPSVRSHQTRKISDVRERRAFPLPRRCASRPRSQPRAGSGRAAPPRRPPLLGSPRRWSAAAGYRLQSAALSGPWKRKWFQLIQGDLCCTYENLQIFVLWFLVKSG